MNNPACSTEWGGGYHICWRDKGHVGMHVCVCGVAYNHETGDECE